MVYHSGDQGGEDEWCYDYSNCEASSSSDSGSNDSNDSNGKDSGSWGNNGKGQTETGVPQPVEASNLETGGGDDGAVGAAQPSSASAGSQPTVPQILDQLSLTSLGRHAKEDKKDDSGSSGEWRGEYASPDKAGGPQTPSNPGGNSSASSSSSQDSPGFPWSTLCFPSDDDNNVDNEDQDGTPAHPLPLAESGSDPDLNPDDELGFPLSSPSLPRPSPPEEPEPENEDAPPSSHGESAMGSGGTNPSCQGCIELGPCPCCGQMLRHKRRKNHRL